jgi:N-acyl-phosphatidylethanolamine-hydrolysing phospholipase D
MMKLHLPFKVFVVLLCGFWLAACTNFGRFAGFAGRNVATLFSDMKPVENKITHPVRPDARLAVLWVGHATCLIQMDDKFILTDPNLTNAVGQISKRLVEPGIDPRNLPMLDAILISHLHYDHLSFGSLELIENKSRILFAPKGGLDYIPKYAFPCVELVRWESWEQDGLRITAVPVKHVGWRYGIDSEWMTTSFTGYILQYHGMTVYFGGDQAYDSTFYKETGRRFPNIDLALLPIAPINPRGFMQRTHTDPKEALHVMADLKAKQMMPIHFDTFINSSDTLGEAPAALREAMQANGLTERDVSILRIGEQKVFIPKN